MSTQIPVPEFPESVEEGTLLAWSKADGDTVSRDEKLADIETDKIVLEVFALEDGVLSIQKKEGEILKRGDILATIQPGSGSDVSSTSDTHEPEEKEEHSEKEPKEDAPTKEDQSKRDAIVTPSARKLMTEHGLSASSIEGSGKGGRIVKKDVEAYLDETPPVNQSVGVMDDDLRVKKEKPEASKPEDDGEGVKRVPMSQIRYRIATRLKEVQDTAAILTTFNEVNMKPVMDIRANYKEKFLELYDVKLGFMSFFVKAATEALKKFPDINAFIDGRDILYHEYINIGIAVSSPRGLVVPVLKDTDNQSFADIERNIKEFAVKAKNNKLAYEDLVGGTFTITNGGVFGSMLSTPILNAPQSAILGMHTITERPVAENGNVVIRPMMYLALSYDHRIVDGSAAVQFLVSIKEALEDPHQLLIQL